MATAALRPRSSNYELFETTLRSPEPTWELRGVVRALLARGDDRQLLIDELSDYLSELGAANREGDWEVVYDVLNLFAGWCHPSLKL
jgi:hypothetical protein